MSELYNYKAHCDRVVDGDTVDVTIDLGFNVFIKDRVRINGVDTPETRTRNLEEKAAGLIVKEFVQDCIEGKDVILISKEFNSTGKYGRILGDIQYEYNSNTEVLSEMLLAYGYARPYSDKGEWEVEKLRSIVESLS